MSFCVSVIPDSFVNGDKSLNNAGVMNTEVEDLGDLGEVITRYHFAPGTFADDHRCVSSFKGTHLLSYDFDSGESVESVVAKLKGLPHLIAASKNHLKDKGDGQGAVPRFHLFLYWVNGIATSAEYSKLINATRERLGLVNTDKKCYDCSRYFYKHSSILSLVDIHDTNAMRRAEFWQQDTIKMTVAKVIKPTVPVARHRTFSQSNQKSNPVDAFKRTKYYKLMVEGGLMKDGERQVNCLKVVGAMRLCGLSRGEAFDLIDTHCEYGNSFTRNRVEGILASYL